MIDVSHPTEPDAPRVASCLNCNAGLAADQRWCLQCGTRRSGLASPFDAAPRTVASVPQPVPPVAVLAPAPERRFPWQGTLAGVAAAAALFGAGLAIGGRDVEPPQTTVNVPAAKAPVVNVSVPAGGAAAATDTALTSDWPGDDGWTVQLVSLPGDTPVADVQAAKADATGKGAADVGALATDDYASLPANKFLIYSGVFTSKAKATAKLKGLKKDFPDAKVVEVSASGGDDAPAKTVTDDDLEKAQDLSPEKFQEQSKKLPDEVQTEGTPPPTDSKPAGGGSEGTTIG